MEELALRARGMQKQVIIIAALCLLSVLALAGILWFHFSLKSQNLANGVVAYDASVTDEEREQLEAVFEGRDLKYHVMISARTVTELPDEEHFALSTRLPVATLYDARQSVGRADLFGPTGEVATYQVQLMEARDLDVTMKVLAIGEDYFFDDMRRGAVFRILEFEGENIGETLAILRNELDGGLVADDILSVTQTGVTALARRMIERLNQVGGDATYFSRLIGPTLRASDITHTINEVSFTDDCRFTTRTTLSFCSPWAMLDAITDAGINLIDLSGNHNNDYGRAAAVRTIERYHELGISTVGGGRNTEEAKQPFTVEMKGSHVVMLAYNQADGPGSPALAGPNAAGVNSWNAERARAEIATAKASGAFVIVNIHYWECWSYPERGTEMPACDLPIGGQREFFRNVAAMGADMVVGTSAHQPQTFEIYKGVPIFYGLGNLWFDQDAWPGTSRSLILTHYFYQGRLLTTRIQPTVFGSELQVRLMETNAAESFLERLGRARPADADRLAMQTTQSVVEEWARGRNVGVLIRNLDTGQAVAQVNSERKFFAASLYKMAVVTEGYLMVQGGQDANAILVGTRTWGQCLDAAIRTSDSPCAETLWARVGQDKATTSMSAADSVRELERIWRGELLAANRALYLDSLLEQEERFRRGLPRGFASDVKVYNKVGWNVTEEWHDAAIVTIGGRNYAVAVLTTRAVPGAMGYAAVRELGSLLDRALRN
jgi:poly-gamma-glutamate capsule biosynthesis protein CapA/YwtB (metallophosphatase superfamily)